MDGGRRWNTGGAWSGIGTQVEFGEVEGGETQVEFGVELEHRWSLRGGRRWNTGGVWSEIGTQLEFERWKAVEHRGVWSGIGTQVEVGLLEGGGTQVEYGVELEHRWSLEWNRNTGGV